MRKILKTFFVLLLMLGFVVGSAIPCFANTDSGTITVVLQDKEKNKISGAKVHLCQIAQLNDTGYQPTLSFEASGISIASIFENPTAAAAKSVTDYIKQNNIKVLSKVSKNGEASFEGLSLGVFVVYPQENSKYTFNPYIVLLPYTANGTPSYKVSSAPKVEITEPGKFNIYVMKKWDDNNNAAKKRPDSIKVNLIKGKKIIASAKLSEANGWAYTFSNLSKKGKYSVKEKQVKNYKADYSGDATNGFVITNTYKAQQTEGSLPQTGQYWWPIILMAIAGTCFVLLGVYEMGVKKNGKKK